MLTFFIPNMRHPYTQCLTFWHGMQIPGLTDVDHHCSLLKSDCLPEYDIKMSLTYV